MKISINADAYTLTTEIKAEDVKLLKKYNSDALVITEKDGDNERIVFSVGYNEGKPSVADFGITFGSKTRDEKGYLTLTEMLPKGLKSNDEAKEYVAGIFGKAIAYIKALEAKIPEAVEAVKKQRKEILDSITVA